MKRLVPYIMAMVGAVLLIFSLQIAVGNRP